jgi:hypothetical protein
MVELSRELLKKKVAQDWLPHRQLKIKDGKAK